MCKKYSKFIKELVEFTNDLSIICSICSLKFLTGIFVLVSLTGTRYASCVSYITKLIVIFLTNINIKSPCGIT